jgi:hypothetical protein
MFSLEVLEILGKFFFFLTPHVHLPPPTSKENLFSVCISENMSKRKCPEKKRELRGLSFIKAKRMLEEENDNEEGGVYYDAGWGDSGKGQYTLGSYDGPEISESVYKRLYKEKIIGGNRLVTFKARKWHPILKPDEVDSSLLGLSLYRDKPYETSWQKKERELTEPSIDDVYGSLEVKQTAEGEPIVWKEISETTTPEEIPKDLVLCSNHIEATLGSPPNQFHSHVWVAQLVIRKEHLYGTNAQSADGFEMFSRSNNHLVHRVKYWAPIPKDFSSSRPLQLIKKDNKQIYKHCLPLDMVKP